MKKESRLFRETHETRNKTTILVLSRGYGSYLDESSHIQMVDKTIEIIEEQFPNYSLLVKKTSSRDTVSLGYSIKKEQGNRGCKRAHTAVSN